MLKRRLEARSSTHEEKRQVKLELSEVKISFPIVSHLIFFSCSQLRRLESDVKKQHRSNQIFYHKKF
jgi:hypothetical protein